MINVYNIWPSSIDFTLFRRECILQWKAKEMLFHFPKDQGVFAPMTATSQMTAWISYSAKVPPAKAGKGPGKPQLHELRNKYSRLHLPHSSILTRIICPVINNSSFSCSINDRRHKAASEFMVLDVNITS